MIDSAEPVGRLPSLQRMDEALSAEREKQPERGHLGLSQIGNPDVRGLWLQHRWCLPPELTPRKLRIFELGDLIEDQVVRNIKLMPGVHVQERDPQTGLQWRAELYGGHCAGHMDGKVIGLPESPKVEHCLEVKSAKNSEFNNFVKLGLRSWKMNYYTQTQCYMGAFKLKRTLFVVENKDTSALHAERIKAEPGAFEQAEIRAQFILERDEPPEPWYTTPNHHDIKHMRSREWKQIYFGEELPVPNCRNCTHSEPRLGGNALWYCKRWKKNMDIVEQRSGCHLHMFIPGLLSKLATMVQHHGNLIRYRTFDKVEFWNVEDKSEFPKESLVFSSHELRALSQGGMINAALADPYVNELRAAVNGEYVDPEIDHAAQT